MYCTVPFSPPLSGTLTGSTCGVSSGKSRIASSFLLPTSVCSRAERSEAKSLSRRTFLQSIRNSAESTLYATSKQSSHHIGKIQLYTYNPFGRTRVFLAAPAYLSTYPSFRPHTHILTSYNMVTADTAPDGKSAYLLLRPNEEVRLMIPRAFTC